MSDQRFASIKALTLESGKQLDNCLIAYKTWGTLNTTGDNVLVICHALSGSADVSDWWRPLLGAGKAFDPRHFFIFCGNVLGSPYGSSSPVSFDVSRGKQYGADFPQTTIRDDIRAHKAVLDALGVKSIASVVGGSMGGMTTLEWPLCTPQGYVKSVIPIATAADHSAWGISWAEAQRQCIYADPRFENGYYVSGPENQPSMGLAAARMVAMLTYRSCGSFDARFGRRLQTSSHTPSAVRSFDTACEEDPSRNAGCREIRHPVFSNSRNSPAFSAQSYLFYQGEKFVKRFDANCYLHLTNKMDTHDLTRGRALKSHLVGDEALKDVLSKAPLKALVIGVETDALFLPEQQHRLASSLPEASLAMIKSKDGHDGFLLEFEQLDSLIQLKLRQGFPHFYQIVLEETFCTEVNTARVSLTGEEEI